MAGKISPGDYRSDVEEFLGRASLLKQVKPEKKVENGIKVTYGFNDGQGVYEITYDEHNRVIDVLYLEEEVKKFSFENRKKRVAKYAPPGKDRKNVERMFTRYGYDLIISRKLDDGEICFYGNELQGDIKGYVIYDKNNCVKKSDALPLTKKENFDVDKFISTLK
ncbi:hypothetical protein [Laceyella putida]|uniref:Uncharacterized protein n=1 Tax=Laceyella putida TaxID=110101 RepID=A0ABW2RNV2_9BACL